MKTPNWKVVDRLTSAMTEYREQLPRDPAARPAFVKGLARRYHLNLATVREAINMMREMESA